MAHSTTPARRGLGVTVVRAVVRSIRGADLIAYGLLAVVLALIWASGGLWRPAVGEPPAATLRTPDAGRPTVQLSEAVASVRKFTGDSRLELEGGLRSDEFGTRTVELYYLESASPQRGEDLYKVDARTGEVVEATMRSRLPPTVPPLGVPLAQGRLVAERFGRERFTGFDTLTLVDQSTRVSDGTAIHTFKWSQTAPESGAELPVSLAIAISSGSGEVVWYLAQRDTLQITVRPLIVREAAIQRAVASLVGRDDRWDTSAPTSVRLQVLYDDDNEQQLVWSVTFAGRQEANRPSIRRLVDAQTGDLIGGA